MTRTVMPLALCTLILSTALAAEAPVKFTRKPTAKREGKSVKIEFAVDRNTDVAVYVLDAKGETVRHLVAGVLGKNPPAPLKPGLEQSITWDGKDDDGKPAGGAPFKIHVGLGLKVGWGGTAFAEKSGPNQLESVQGLTVGPDGRLYVVGRFGAWLYWGGTKVLVFHRDGNYERTIKPFPANLPLKRVKATGAFTNSFGNLNPLIHRPLGFTFYSHEHDTAPAVTSKGKIILAVRSAHVWHGRGGGALGMIDTQGGVPEASYAGPPLKAGFADRTQMVPAADDKSVYMVGLGPHSAWKASKPWNAVYRVKLPDRGPAEVFFGEPDKPGNDNAHLNGPTSIAFDGKGHLLVADFGNNRVVVLGEKDGKFVGSFKVEAPIWVAAHPKSGAVYACSKRTTVIKFSGWRKAKELSRVDFDGLLKKVKRVYRRRTKLHFALDAAAEPPVLWVGCGHQLARCEDRGGKFSDAAPAGYYNPTLLWRPDADPLRREISCRVGSTWARDFRILNEETGKVRTVRLGGEGATYRLGPRGQIYGLWHGSNGVYRHDRNGKRLPFAATASDPKLKGNIPGASTTAAWERDFWVDRGGNVYAKARGDGALTSVDVYGPDGKLKRTALWGITDGSYGPRVDAKGNIYMMECITPEGKPFPEEFKGRPQGKYGNHWYEWIYGSIVKFSPAGGNIWIKPHKKEKKPKAAPVALPGSFKKEKVRVNLRGDGHEMQGALWRRDGISPLGGVALCRGGTNHCHCTGCDFDVDGFGRVFAPDTGRFRVAVFDTNGNDILSFGAYGNQDFCGPESYVLDPEGKFLRPRKPGDPKDIKSPFAHPEIAFGWIVGLAVTDRHAYVDDVLNKRMLRCKLGYAAEETCNVR